MTKPELYHARNSVCSQKVRLCLAEIGLPWEGRLLDLMAGDQYAPEYLALNPEAVVPTLVDDGRVVVESSLICEYLDRTYNGGTLMPDDPAHRIGVSHWLLRSIQLHAAINALTFSTANRGAKFKGLDAAARDRKLARMPNPLARLRLVSLTDDGLTSPFVAQALVDLRRAFGDMSRALARHDWLSGPDFGLGDIGVIPYVDRLDRLGFGGLWAQDFPGIDGWIDRMRARPAFAQAIDAVAPEGSFERMRSGAAPFREEVLRLWAVP